MKGELIVTHGYNGWGNRKSGCEAYGPGGRWDTTRAGVKSEASGDLLGDHLDELGAHEGSPIIAITSTSRFDGGEPFGELEEAVKAFVEQWAADHP